MILKSNLRLRANVQGIVSHRNFQAPEFGLSNFCWKSNGRGSQGSREHLGLESLGTSFAGCQGSWQVCRDSPEHEACEGGLLEACACDLNRPCEGFPRADRGLLRACQGAPANKGRTREPVERENPVTPSLSKLLATKLGDPFRGCGCRPWSR